MKKMAMLLMLGALSVVSFAYDGSGEKCDGKHEKKQGMHNKQEQMKGHNNQGMKKHNFDKTLDVEALKKIGVSEANIEKANNLVKEAHKAAELRHLDIEEKRIALEREQLADSKNWAEIERLIEEISELKAKQEISRLKTKDALSKIIPMDKYHMEKKEERACKNKQDEKGNMKHNK